MVQVANRLTLENIKNTIKDVSYIVNKDTCLTICILSLKNGFNIVETSACIDPSMFDESIGKNIAYEKAEKKIWELLGFYTKELKYQYTHNDLVAAESDVLSTRIRNLENFIASEYYKTLSEDNQDNLRSQLHYMSLYSGILKKRLTTA